MESKNDKLDQLSKLLIDFRSKIDELDTIFHGMRNIIAELYNANNTESAESTEKIKKNREISELLEQSPSQKVLNKKN